MSFPPRYTVIQAMNTLNHIIEEVCKNTGIDERDVTWDMVLKSITEVYGKNEKRKNEEKEFV